MWIKIRELNRSVTRNLDDYDEKYMKNKFNSDDNVSLNKIIEICIMEVVVRVAFLKNNKYYQQVFLDECLYKIWMKSKNELKKMILKIVCSFILLR